MMMCVCIYDCMYARTCVGKVVGDGRVFSLLTLLSRAQLPAGLRANFSGH
jgi:hypothetical protein